MKFPESFQRDIGIKEDAIDPNQSMEGKMSIEQKQALIDAHLDQLKTIAVSSLQEKQGEVDGVKFENVFSAGKQQPTPIMELSFPEGGSFGVVFRPTRHSFADLYEKYEVVKKYFPHLFAKIDVEDNPTSPSTVLVIDRIKGYDSKFGREEYQKHIADPAHFESMCRETFQMVNKIYQQPLELVDIGPTAGHNVIYNTETKKFQFFDIDTIHASDRSIDRKFMDFLNPKQVPNNDDQIKYLVREMQLYLEAYPAGFSSYEGEEVTRGEIIPVENPGDEKGLVYPDNPAYEGLYTSVDRRGTQGRADLPPLRVVRTIGKDVSSFSPEFIEAVKAKDFEKAKEYLIKLKGNLVQTEFVPN